MQMTIGFLVLAVLLSQSLTVVLSAEDRCFDTDTHDIKLEELLGVWYPIEIILHRNDSKIYGVPTESQCPEVTITMLGKKGLKMYWNATDGDLEYRYVQKGRLSSPLFQVTSEQTGTLVNEHYKQFGGVLQVVKVDDDYLFLTFCALKGWLLNTVAFSRNEQMSEEIIKETLEALEAKKHKRARWVTIHPCESSEDSNQPGGAGVALSSATSQLLFQFVRIALHLLYFL